ncbi:MAG: hypothetical protein MJZ09_03435 [Bacteroidales bacterium]|nr:hypothetical protein [Bacteroidales bacterium]
MKRIVLLILSCGIVFSCQDKQPCENAAKCSHSISISAGFLHAEATKIETKVPKDTTVYDFIITDDFVPGDEVLFTGEVIFHREGNNVVENVYDENHTLLLTHVYNDFGCVSITEYIDEEALGVSLSPSSTNGYRRRGEGYGTCVRRVTDDYYNEDFGSVTDAYLGGIKWAMAHYIGVIGCSKYVDQPL